MKVGDSDEAAVHDAVPVERGGADVGHHSTEKGQYQQEIL